MFQVGQIVQLKADETIQGAITEVIHTSPENSYSVFTNSLGIQTYIESQISDIEFITDKEAAENWGISLRQVQYLCSCGLIPGAIRHDHSWKFSKTTKMLESHNFKPAYKKAGERPKKLEASEENEKGFFDILEQFPVPIQVYRPSGLLIFANRVGLDMIHLPSFDVFEGSFNILTDPVIDTWGDVREEIRKSFQGETVRFENMKVPLSDIIKRFEINELCFDSSFQNIICFPIYDDNSQLTYVIHLFITMNLFTGKEEIVKAKEYLDTYWFEEFDIDKVASFVNLSRYHFARMFKKHTSMTPYVYYQELKIKKLKEALGDENLTISEAFAACGLDYSGNYAKVFRKKVGMTPSQYRKSIKE